MLSITAGDWPPAAHAHHACLWLPEPEKFPVGSHTVGCRQTLVHWLVSTSGWPDDWPMRCGCAEYLAFLVMCRLRSLILQAHRVLRRSRILSAPTSGKVTGQQLRKSPVLSNLICFLLFWSCRHTLAHFASGNRWRADWPAAPNAPSCRTSTVSCCFGPAGTLSRILSAPAVGQMTGPLAAAALNILHF
jgi:hypothetical protein